MAYGHGYGRACGVDIVHAVRSHASMAGRPASEHGRMLAQRVAGGREAGIVPLIRRGMRATKGGVIWVVMWGVHAWSA